MKAETGGLLSAGSEISLKLGVKTRSVAFSHLTLLISAPLHLVLRAGALIK